MVTGDAMNWLWPISTGKSAVDVWTIFHLAFWIYMGSNFWSFNTWIDRPRAMLIGLVLAYLWEIFERYAERKWPHMWLTPESWYNAYVSDPLTCVVGMLFAWYALDNWR